MVPLSRPDDPRIGGTSELAGKDNSVLLTYGGAYTKISSPAHSDETLADEAGKN
ncbi:uncharacterized protein ATNIH1004_010182 [Aspergillus tanneri]|uniref:Uncharacterized protein n=1 Tax=Aspergillus tanneri TaxID=1220188 RepID=A0A5M9MEK5_9EURO|nr:uncharacterized protein ATNIH1004_010182 [Aspergillus tanneri]KAA8643413.1 hypothetical protein ATNIH1004_010182 [Aspergillus tanneri]